VETAKGRDPSLPLVYEALSSVRLFKRQHEEAVDAARRWIEIEPSNAAAYANLAGILHFAGEPERVAGLIEKAKRINLFYPFYYMLLCGPSVFTLPRFEDVVATSRGASPTTPNPCRPTSISPPATASWRRTPLRARPWQRSGGSADFSIAWLRTIAAYKREADLDLLIDGLRKAGLRE
jgi:adenylate cyclase